MSTPARLLTLLSLLQTPREWPGSELARRLEVSPRTVRRDVERLRELGYPVVATMGTEGGYRLVAGSAIPPLLLADEEAVAIAVALRGAAGHAVEGVGEAAVRGLAKLEQVLPSRLRYRVGALSTAIDPVPAGVADTVDPAVLTTLAAAIANTERVRFTYRSRAGERGKRHVDPYRLVPVNRRWYLVAFDNDRDDWRVFRADRMSEPFATGARAVPRALPSRDAAKFVTDTLYSLAPTYAAVVTVHAPADRVGGRLGDVEPLDDGSCRVRCHADTVEWLAFRLILLGHEFEVHEPPELVEYLRALGDRLRRAVGSPPDTAAGAEVSEG